MEHRSTSTRSLNPSNYGNYWEKYIPAFDFPRWDFYYKFLSDPLYVAILKCPSFQRLHKIAFLGGLAFPNHAAMENSRGDHTMGVSLLTYYYCKLVGLPLEAERKLVVSALLHDIHHLPFSHTMDLAFHTENPKFSLWDETKRLMLVKQTKQGESIADILWGFQITLNSLPLFQQESKQHWLLSSTHNVDTLDGIHRAHLLLFNEPLDKQLPIHIIDTFVYSELRNHNKQDATVLLDRFWELKNKVYIHGIYNAQNFLFERIISYYLYEVVKNNNVLDKITTLTDEDLLNISSEVPEKLIAIKDFVESEMSNKDVDVQDLTNNASYTGDNKHAVYGRHFFVNKSKRLIIPNALKKSGRYKIAPYKWVISIRNDFYDGVDDILGFPLLKKYSEKIAKTDNEELLL